MKKIAAFLCMVVLCVNSGLAQNYDLECCDIILGTSTGDSYDGPTLLHLKQLNTPFPPCDYDFVGSWLDWGQSTSDSSCATLNPADPDWMQGVEFDNCDFISHNADGNLLTVNFGNSWAGLTIYNVSTNNTIPAYEELWGIVGQTDGECGVDPVGRWRSQRGTGLSVSPCNDKVAVSPCNDFPSIFVLDYDAGMTPGTGSGAWIGGPRETDFNATYSAYPMVGGTANTTWFNNNTLLWLNNAGRVGIWYVGNTPPGTDASEYDHQHDGDTPMQPTMDANWQFVNNELQDLGYSSLQYSDIEYNPECDPNHVYVGFTRSNYKGYLARFNIVTAAQGTTLVLDCVLEMPAPHEPREIAFDCCCNLIWTNYAGSGNNYMLSIHRDPINDLCNLQEVGYLANQNPQYSPWTGMDVAKCMPIEFPPVKEDLNNDGTVDDLDLGFLLSAWGTSGTGDLDDNGIVDDLDLGILLAAWGKQSGPDCDPAPISWYGTGSLFSGRR